MKPALRILEPGLAASLQDSGRLGLQRFGVPVSGALDAVSLALANILAGNPPGTAAIEILGAGFAFEIEAESVTLALAGMADGFTLQSERRRYPRSCAAERQRPARRYRPHPRAERGSGLLSRRRRRLRRSTSTRKPLHLPQGGARRLSGPRFPGGRRPSALPRLVQPRSRPHRGRYPSAGVSCARCADPTRRISAPALLRCCSPPPTPWRPHPTGWACAFKALYSNGRWKAN